MSRSPEAVTMGEILIDFMGRPAGQPVQYAESFVKKAGGAPANVAVGLARLERPSAFIGMVGDDAFGAFLRETLETEGVDTRGLATCPDQPTTLAFVSSDEHGVPSFAFYRHPGADQSLRPEDVALPLFDDARVFHFGSLSLINPPASEATYHCLETARAKRMFVTYDPNYRPALWGSHADARNRMLEPLHWVDLLKVSEDELLMLSGKDDLVEGCAALMERGPGLIVITRGERGMIGWNQGAVIELPGVEVDVVDTTGCGDASMAGIIAYLLEQGVELGRNMTLDPDVFTAALDYGNRCAAIAATRLGAIPALPRRAELVGEGPAGH